MPSWMSLLSPCRPTFQKLTDKCPSIRMTGTCWGAKSYQEKKYLLTRSALLAWHRRLTAGLESRRCGTLGPMSDWKCSYDVAHVSRRRLRGLLTFFVLCAVLGVPLSWHKTSGGEVLVWVGFELLLQSRCVGMSSRRAEWFARWTQNIADSKTVNMASFEDGLGRIMFVAGALEHEHFWALFTGLSAFIQRNQHGGFLHTSSSYCVIFPTKSPSRGTITAVRN